MVDLVTGASGFLGSHLVEELLKQQRTVKVLSRINSHNLFLEKLNCEVITGDILDLNSLEKAFKGVTNVYHCAGYMSSNPLDKNKLNLVNVDGVENIVKACQNQNVSRLLHVSSAVAVGASDDEKKLFSENDPFPIFLNSFTNYASKKAGEDIVLKATKENQLNAVVVNPSLIYGPRDALKEMRKGNIQVAKGKMKFYPAGGVNVVSVSEVVKAMISAVEIGQSGHRYLLTGENIYIKDLFSFIAKAAGVPEPSFLINTNLLKILSKMDKLLHLNSPLSEENVFAITAYHWYDNSKAKKDLNFNPRSASEVIAESVNWMKSNGILRKK